MSLHTVTYLLYDWENCKCVCVNLHCSAKLKINAQLTCFQSCHNVNYHMTSTAPRVISLEIHKKKVPEWGPYALRTDRARKTCTALLEMHTALAKTMRNNFEPTRKKLSYDKMLIDWVRSGQTGKYLPLILTLSQIFSRPALPLSQ